MVGITLAVCRKELCANWDSCEGQYITTGQEFLGRDEQKNRHYLCGNFKPLLHEV